MQRRAGNSRGAASRSSEQMGTKNKSFRMHARVCEGRKKFFFEKTNQKTFATWDRDRGNAQLHGPKVFLLLFFKKEVLSSLSVQRRPSRIRRVRRRRHLPLVESGNIDRNQPRRKSTAPLIARLGLAPEHQHPAVRRKGRPFHRVALRQDALTGPVRVHDADGEGRARKPGERDQVPTRRTTPASHTARGRS